MKTPHVSITFPNWNNTDETLICVKHILASSYKDVEVIVVDNGSRDDEWKKLYDAYGNEPHVKLVRNVDNKGYCEACNIGILNSHPASKWGMTFNGDVKVGKNWLRELVDAVERSGAWGGTCTKFTPDSGDSFGVTSVTGFGGQFSDPVLREEFLKTRTMETLTVSGAWFIFDKKKVGLPYPNDYILYAEDTHLGMRIWLNGGKVMRYYSQDPEGFAEHFGGRILKKRRPQFGIYVGTRNRMRNILSFYSPMTLFKITPLVLVSQLALILLTPKVLPGRLWAYGWLLTHPRTILRQRSELQKQRKVDDSVLLYNQTCNLVNDTEVPAGIARHVVRSCNKVALAYGRLVGLPTRDVLLSRRKTDIPTPASGSQAS